MNKLDLKEIGAMLRAERERQGLSISEFARQSHIPRESISYVENATRGAGIKKLQEVARKLGCRFIISLEPLDATPEPSEAMATNKEASQVVLDQLNEARNNLRNCLLNAKMANIELDSCKKQIRGLETALETLKGTIYND